MKIKIFLFIITLIFFSTLTAQEMVYKPINPSFIGGNSFNANWLFSQANAQSFYKETSASQEQRTELDRFTESLNRQLLSQLSRNLFTDQFGEDGIQEGTFTFGSLVVDVSPTSEGMSFSIFDTATGEQTVIIVPNP